MKTLNAHLKDNNSNISQQYGYKKGHSCETLLAKLLNDVLLGFDHNFATVLILLDPSAAFDTVNTNILLSIWRYQIGIRGIAYEWFSSFLYDRIMSGKVNESYSKVHVLKSGVAQGSVLGPVLFNIYIRSFYEFVEHEGYEIKGVADDHQIYASFSPTYRYQFLVSKLECIFASVDLWMSKFFLKLNPLKSQIIVYCNNILKRLLNINGFILNNSCIRFCETVKNLGFTFDTHLTLEQQVQECVSSVFASIKSITGIKHLLTRQEVIILVSLLIVSKLDYCNALYYHSKKSNASVNSLISSSAITAVQLPRIFFDFFLLFQAT